jgi:transposase
VSTGNRGRPRTRPARVLEDKAYTSKANRDYLTGRGIKVTIPECADQKQNRARRGSEGGRPRTFDKDAYKGRNVVERCFNRLKQWRDIATRSDKTARSYPAGVTFAAALIWIKSGLTCSQFLGQWVKLIHRDEGIGKWLEVSESSRRSSVRTRSS